jgi:hypothetical protein
MLKILSFNVFDLKNNKIQDFFILTQYYTLSCVYFLFFAYNNK